VYPLTEVRGERSSCDTVETTSTPEAAAESRRSFGPQDEDDAGEPAVGVAPVAAGHGHPDAAARAGPHVDLLLGDPGDAAELGGAGPALLPDQLPVAGAGVERLVGRGADQVLGGTAQKLDGGPVERGDDPGGVEDDDGIGQLVDEVGGHESPL